MASSDLDADPEGAESEAGSTAADAAELARRQEFLRRSRLHVDQAIYLFQNIIERIRAGEDVPARESERSAQALLAAVQTFFTIRMRLDDDTDPDTAIAEDGDLDLDDARNRILGLLDRLRPASDPG